MSASLSLSYCLLFFFFLGIGSSRNENRYSFLNSKDSRPLKDEYFISEALSLAELAHGRTRPNPIVGCILVSEINGTSTVVGKGYHRRSGEAHAEVLALLEAGNLANGSTAYVSLEPCNHYGRTPPCTLALLRSGVRRVVAGMVDPDPRVSGGGLRMLRSNGVDAILIKNKTIVDLCKASNAAFIFRVKRRRAYSIVCCALVGNSARSIFSLPDEVLDNLITAAPDADTIILTSQQFLKLQARRNDSCLPDHCNIVLILEGNDENEAKEIFRLAIEDRYARKYIFILRSVKEWLLESFQKLNSKDRNRIALLRALSSPIKGDCTIASACLLISSFIVIHSAHLTFSNDGKCCSNNYDESITHRESCNHFKESLLQFLAKHSGSNAVLFTVDTAEELNQFIRADAVQRVVLLETGEEESNSVADDGSRSPPHFLRALRRTAGWRMWNRKGKAVLLSDHVRSSHGKHSIWKYDVWSPP